MFIKQHCFIVLKTNKKMHCSAFLCAVGVPARSLSSWKSHRSPGSWGAAVEVEPPCGTVLGRLLLDAGRGQRLPFLLRGVIGVVPAPASPR